MSIEPPKTVTHITSAAVFRATGKTWPEWFSVLDDLPQTHPGALLDFLKSEVPVAWWAHVIRVTYEKFRGLRKTHQRNEGFRINVTHTVALPIDKIFALFIDPDYHRLWLNKPITIAQSVPNKRLQLTVDTQCTHVLFYERSTHRTQVIIDIHLDNFSYLEHTRQYWRSRLKQLSQKLSEHGLRISASAFDI